MRVWSTIADDILLEPGERPHEGLSFTALEMANLVRVPAEPWEWDVILATKRLFGGVCVVVKGLPPRPEATVGEFLKIIEGEVLPWKRSSKSKPRAN